MSKKIRLNIPIDLEVNDRVEAEAKKLGISKNGMIRMMIYEYFKQQDVLNGIDQLGAIKEMIEMAQKQND